MVLGLTWSNTTYFKKFQQNNIVCKLCRKIPWLPSFWNLIILKFFENNAILLKISKISDIWAFWPSFGCNKAFTLMQESKIRWRQGVGILKIWAVAQIMFMVVVGFGHLTWWCGLPNLKVDHICTFTCSSSCFETWGLRVNDSLFCALEFFFSWFKWLNSVILMTWLYKRTLFRWYFCRLLQVSYWDGW